MSMVPDKWHGTLTCEISSALPASLSRQLSQPKKQSPVCFCWRSNGFCKVLALVAFCKKADAKILQFSQGFMKRCCHMKLHVIPPANWNTHRARIQELPGSCGKNHRVDPKMIGSSKNLSQTVAWCNLVDDQKWTFKIWELLRCKSDHKSAENSSANLWWQDPHRSNY